MSESFWKDELETDLMVERFYRSLGIKIALLVKPLPVTPNQITLFRVILGIGIFYLFAFSDRFLTLFLLMVLWKILDKVDGALARASNRNTKFGGWLDMAIDRLFWGFALLGMTISVYKNLSNLTPWFLLFAILLGHTLFQNFTFLKVGKQPTINWKAKKKSFKKNLLYQAIFSIYYLNDQVIALALLLYYPVKILLNFDTLLLTLILYALFFNLSTLYVAHAQYKTLTSTR